MTTYWASTRIVDASKEYGWRIRPIVKPGAPWTIHKDGVRIEIKERPDGGLAWCSLGRNMTTRYDIARLDSHVPGKLDIVLRWLSGDFEAHRQIVRRAPRIMPAP